MENRKRYALVTILNDKFVLPAKVMLYSFFCNNPWFDGDVVVMSSDDDLMYLSEASKRELSSMSPAIKFVTIKNSEYTKAYEHFQDIIPITLKCTLYKLSIFGLSQYEKIVYVDSDMLILKSLRDLFESNIHLGAAPDIPLSENQDETYLKYENIFIRNKEYFNTGIIVIDKKFLSTRMKGNIISFAEKFPIGDKRGSYGGIYPDQDIINKFVERYCDISILPIKYNMPQRRFINGNRDVKDECVIHYLGGEKPWLNKDERYQYIYSVWYNWRDNYLKSLREGGIIVQNLHGMFGNRLWEIAVGFNYAQKHNKDIYFQNLFDFEKDYWEGKSVKFLHDKILNIERHHENEYVSERFKNEPILYIAESGKQEKIHFPNDNVTNVFVQGLFQKEEYIDKKICRQIFKCDNGLRKQIYKKYPNIEKMVGICIRRGDFLSESNKKIFVNPSVDWFIECYNKYFSGKSVIVSSDDIDFAQENLILENCPDIHFISNDISLEERFYTCCFCGYHIIPAASTFAWWTAYLYDCPERLTITTPRRFFPECGINEEGGIPEHWVRESCSLVPPP